jgi:hypothetical protein
MFSDLVSNQTLQVYATIAIMCSYLVSGINENRPQNANAITKYGVKKGSFLSTNKALV